MRDLRFFTILICFFIVSLTLLLPRISLSGAVLYQADSSSQRVVVEGDVEGYLTAIRSRVACTVLDVDADEVLRKYKARVVFCESACGVTSLYCFSPSLPCDQRINGERVNLHVAIYKEGVKIGIPIICDGF